MSFIDGMAAIRLEKPPRIPRTEYSAESHWELVQAVTGIQVDHMSDAQTQQNARSAFVSAWNYDFKWSTYLSKNIMKNTYTQMGHAVYASGGVDYQDELSCPFQDVDDVLAFDPMETYGVVDIAEATETLNRHFYTNMSLYPGCVNMTGSYSTCVSGLIDMFGWELLLEAAGTDPKRFGHVTNRYGDYIHQYFHALAATDADVIMVHDDICWTSGQIFHTEWYQEFVFPNLKRHVALLLDAGKKVIYTSDGTYTMFLDDLARIGVHGFVLEPTTDLAYAAEKFGKTHVLIGNADTRILLSGSREDIHAEVKRCMDIGRDCNGFFMAVGNHIPSNTPVENCLYYNDCYEKMSRR